MQVLVGVSNQALLRPIEVSGILKLVVDLGHNAWLLVQLRGRSAI